MSTDPVQSLINRLESGGFGPRTVDYNLWLSRCPAHRGPDGSLSVRRGGNGQALLHCEACGAPDSEILSALVVEADPQPDVEDHEPR